MYAPSLVWFTHMKRSLSAWSSLLLLALLTGSGAAQERASVPRQGAAVDLTLRTRADYLYIRSSDGARHIIAMVIWRGTEQWYRRGRSSIVLPMRGMSDTLPIVVEATYVGTRTSFSYVPSSHILRILDQEFLMDPDSNVVLVDVGMSPGAPPRIVGRARLRPVPDGADADRRSAILRQATESVVLRQFLELP